MNPSDAANDDWAGDPGSLSGNVAVIGSWRHDNNSGDSGAVWVFANHGGTTWTQTQKLVPADNVDHTLVIISGNLYGFGSNGFGQLGDPDITLITSTAGVINDTMVWKDVEAGGFHSLAVNDQGQAFAWGKNSHGQLGTGDRLLQSTPTAIAGMTNVVGLAAGHAHSLFLVDNGSTRSCYSVGNNRQGQAGQTTDLVLSPMMVNSYTTVNEISAGPYSSMLIVDGVWVKQWGQLGDGREVALLEVFTEL